VAQPQATIPNSCSSPQRRPTPRHSKKSFLESARAIRKILGSFQSQSVNLQVFRISRHHFGFSSYRSMICIFKTLPKLIHARLIFWLRKQLQQKNRFSHCKRKKTKSKNTSFLAPICFLTLVNSVNPSLIQENEKDNVVSENAQSMHGWHFDDEREHVVDECVQSLLIVS
jgi:hypothetical protein